MATVQKGSLKASASVFVTGTSGQTTDLYVAAADKYAILTLSFIGVVPTTSIAVRIGNQQVYILAGNGSTNFTTGIGGTATAVPLLTFYVGNATGINIQGSYSGSVVIAGEEFVNS